MFRLGIKNAYTILRRQLWEERLPGHAIRSTFFYAKRISKQTLRLSYSGRSWSVFVTFAPFGTRKLPSAVRVRQSARRALSIPMNRDVRPVEVRIVHGNLGPLGDGVV